MSEPFKITTEKRVFSKTVQGTMESGGRKTSIKATTGVFGTRYEVLSDFMGMMPHPIRRNSEEPPGYVQVNLHTLQVYYADGTLAATENRKREKIQIEGVVAVGDEYCLGISGNFDAIFSLIKASSQLQGTLKMFQKVAEGIGDVAPTEPLVF